MKGTLSLLLASLAVLASPRNASAQIPPSIMTPDRVDTRIGRLEFKDGAPTVETAEKVRDTLDFTRALNVYNNSFRGASAYAIGKGFQSIGAEDNTIVIFSELMDAKSLFLTANADTVYFIGVLNLSKGPLVVEQPPGSLGTFNDMWFSWIIDGGFPGPDRGAGGKYLLVPPGYEGPVPDGGFFVAKSKTNRVLYAFRAFLVKDDPKPAVENIKKNLKIYPYTPGGYGTSIGTALEGKVRLAQNPEIPATKFVEATGKAFNTVPPSDYGFFEMINANVQQEPATSYDVELAGQLAAIGIVKGKPFNPDARMKKILSDAAAVGNAAGRMLNWRYTVSHPDWAYYPGSKWGSMLWEGGAFFETPPPRVQRRHVPAVAADRRAHARLPHRVLLRLHDGLAGHDHAGSRHRLAVPHGLPGCGRQPLRRRKDLQGHASQGHSRAGVLVVHALRQPVPLDARHAATLPARGQPELSLSRGEGERRRSTTSISPRPSPRGSSAGTGSRPCPARAGSRSCASTARSRRSSTRAGARARSRS